MTAHSQADIEAAAWLFENTLDLFIVIHDGRVARVNPAWARLMGWADDEVIGGDLHHLAHPDDEAVYVKAWEDLNATGQTHVEHRLRTKAGEHLWFRTWTKRTAENDFVMVMQDVTEAHARKVASEQGQRANDLLRSAAGITVWRYDPDQNLYEFDPDFSRPIGARAPEENADIRESNPIANAIHRDDADEMTRSWEQVLATGEPGMAEYRYRVEDHWRRLRTAWRGVREAASGRWEVLGITQDVTELSNARDAAINGEQAAQAAAEAKSQFLANMSHEIRTPMNGVLGVLHLLKSESLSPEGRRLLDEALSCGRMLAELLNDVIDFSKIEAGCLELAPEPVDLACAVHGVLDLLAPQAEAKDLYLRASIAPSAGWISADPVRLRQILFNLVGNALKFTAHGGVEVRVALRGRGARQRMRVEIEDTGVGIPEDAKARLFLRFNQGDNSTTRKFGGSGLGLAITQSLAEIMGGEVGFESREGVGSTFWIEAPAPAVEAPVAVSDNDERWLDGLRVLVVEDNPTNRLIATKMLENLGASVETADDGKQGVEAAQRQTFDLIFMDIQMPVMDGLSAARAIRALPTSVSAIPIVAMTANALAHQVESYRAAGMNGSVFKPLSPKALLTELARVSAADDPVALSA